MIIVIKKVKCYEKLFIKKKERTKKRENIVYHIAKKEKEKVF